MNKLRRKSVFVFVMIYLLNVLPSSVLRADAAEAGSYPWADLTDIEVEDWPEGPEIEAEAAILVEFETGAILYEKNMHKQMYPASITKILTTLIALENISDYSEIVTFSHDSVYSIEPGSSHIGITEGEQLSVDQCLHAIMLASANECSYALGEYTAGEDYEAFIQMMNDKADELGAADSHFMNAHGLPDDDHYTSAYDMSLFAREAYTYDKFRELISTYSYEIPETNLVDEPRVFQNHHKMLPNSKYPYDGCLGGKTGYTTAAGNTLVTFAERDGMTLIAVVLRASAYPDTKLLLDYGFDNYSVASIRDNQSDPSELSALLDEVPVTGDEETPYLAMSESGTVVLPSDVSFSDLTPVLTTDVTSDDYLGTLMYTYEGRYVGYINLEGRTDETDESIIAQIYTPEKSEKRTLRPAKQNSSDEETAGSGISLKLVITVVILIIMITGTLIFSRYLKKIKRR